MLPKKMKPEMILIMMIIVLNPFNTTTAQDTFQKVYSKQNDGCSSIRPTNDGGYILAGSHKVNPGRWDLYLMKINAGGDIIWANNYGGEGFTHGTFADQTDDGGYIACGYSQPEMAGAYKIVALKTDATGNLIWSKKFGGHQFSTYQAYRVHQTTDGGFIICGYAAPEIAGPRAAFLIKTDAVGDTLWTRAYPGNRDSFGYCVEQTSDGGYIMSGQARDSLDVDIMDVLLVKTNTEGDTLWTRTFGGANEEIGYAVKQTPDGGYVVAGQTGSMGSGADDFFITKTSPDGNLLWTKAYGGDNYERAKSIDLSQDGGYIVAGYSSGFGNGNGDLYMLETSENGDLDWARTYGSSGFDNARCVTATSDGGYLAIGETNGFGNYGIYLVKTDAEGYSGCNENNTNTIVTSQAFGLSGLEIHVYSGCSTSELTLETGSYVSDTTLCFIVGTGEIKPANTKISISPNPFSSVATIRSDAGFDHSTIKIMDAFGRQVKQIKNMTGHTIVLHRDHLSAGLYFVMLVKDNETIAMEKIVVVDP